MEICLRIGDNDFIAEWEYKFSSYGCGPSPASLSYPGDPGEPAEWEWSDFELFTDEYKWIDDQRVPKRNKLECPKWLEEVIMNSDKVNEVMQEIAIERSCDDYD